MLLLFILKLHSNKNNNKTRNNNVYLNYLTIEGRRRRSGYIPRIYLVNPISIPFVVLISSADDDALIKETGLDF